MDDYKEGWIFYFSVAAFILFIFVISLYGCEKEKSWKKFENIDVDNVYIATGEIMSRDEKNEMLFLMQKKGYRVEKVEEKGIYFVKISN